MVLNTLTLETSRVLTLTISETIGMKNEYIVNSHLRLLPCLANIFGSRGSKNKKRRNGKLNTIPQVAKVYIFTNTCQR